jgi:hypothetical protein
MQCFRKERAGSFQTVGYCIIINKKIHAKDSGLSTLPALKRLVLQVWLTFKCVDSLDFFPGELLKYSLKEKCVNSNFKNCWSLFIEKGKYIIADTNLANNLVPCCWWPIFVNGLNPARYILKQKKQLGLSRIPGKTLSA